MSFSVLSPFVGSGKTAITCNYSTTQISGNASNSGSLLTFSSQPVNDLQKTGSSTLCPSATATVPAMTFSATFGPLTDTTATGSPAVFVN